MKTKKRCVKKNKTRKIKKNKIGGNKRLDGCINSKCKLWMEQAEKTVKDFKKMFEKNHINSLKKEKKICGNEKTKEECEKIKDTILFQKTLLENIEKDKEKNQKMELDICKKIYCNEGCKNTILEDGDGNILPKSLTKLFKENDVLLEYMKNSRKELFKDKKSVLKNGFFEGLKPSQIKKLEKEGAISGCTKAVPK